jgi:hypothetical protein
VPGTSHIAFKHILSDEEIWAIVHYQLHSNICMRKAFISSLLFTS